MFEKIGFNLLPIPICGDNQGSIFMGNNPVTEHHTKYIPIRFHYIRDTVQKCQVKIFYIEGTDNPADMFMKNPGYVKFERCRSQLGLVFHNTSSCANTLLLMLM